MSNSSSFNNKPNRNRLFAVTCSGTGAATAFNNAGYYDNLRQRLISWGDANGYNFTASAADGHDPKTIDGFNLEGMVFAPDNTTLYLGFRAPLVPAGSRTKAVIAPIQNFEAFFNSTPPPGPTTGSPTIGAPIELNLGGRGIRDIIRLSNGNYIIAAGSYDGALNPAVYSWTGNPASAPVQLTSFDVSALNIEGVLQVNTGGLIALDKLQFLSDDGSNVLYGDGIQTKDLAQDNFKKYSSDIVIGSSGVLPVDFVYFTAGRQNNDVLLKWQTEQANTTKTFEILRSLNGRDFVSVTVVNTAAGQTAYTYTDANITGDRIYYRIKAIEYSSREYLSAVRLVNTAGTALVTVYPDPVTNNRFTIATKNTGNKTVQVYTASGALYAAFNFSENAKDINTALWSKGNYFIRIVNNDGSETVSKLIVQ
jgi:hypothetical protein